MKNTFHLLVFVSLVTAAGFAAVAAQERDPDTDPDLDIEAIRARAGEFTQDAEALADTVRGRAQTLVEDVRDVQRAAEDNRAGYVASVDTQATGDVLDFDAMVREHAVAERSAFGTAPRFIAFASLSMPEAALKALVRDMGRAGGVTVLRGFPDGDARRFKQRLAAIWSDGDETGALGIDPRLFRAFGIQSAPSFVMLGSDFSPCDGFDCTSVLPPHDRVAGNVSVTYVLETFAGGDGPGAAAARHHLHQLKGTRP
ncbi:type-F conjugative transfer system pilin assembly protein TrbC [Erythrobacter sp. EC-HK427]|uniref:type-F conjugative transfer system pilin assembly protein TrbC n=1 Tax=Erythrobacter sp. EC-HK427 TaxID=2038396 RepID=UPI00125189FD|nr:type-F conjugative transfer system pilin assembly protein TrbC [Erythrobacter sp. EC-HK427]VVT00653.1 Conjugal transfer protein TrbC [Erythrobacter sp. EC-HK427]